MTPRSLFNSPNLPPVPSSLNLSEPELLLLLDAVGLPHDRLHSVIDLIEETVLAIEQVSHEGYCRAVRFAFEGYVHPDDVPDEPTLPESREVLTEWLLGSAPVKVLRPEAVAYILWRISRVRASVDADVLAKHLFSLAATVHCLGSITHTNVPKMSTPSSSNKPSKGTESLDTLRRQHG